MESHSSVLVNLAAIMVRPLFLAALGGAAMALLRIKSPAARHAIWTQVTAGMLLLAAARLLLPAVAPGGLPDLPLRVLPAPRMPEAVVIPVYEPAAAMRLPQPSRPIPAPFPWGLAAASLYLAGACCCGARLAYGLLLTRRLVRSARPLPEFAGERVFEAAAISVPMTLGWLHARILLPTGWDSWSAAKLNAVMVHERTHAARGDWAVSVLAGVNCCVFWFHPLAWWLERRLSALAELACDDASLAQVDSRAGYAEVLVEMAAAVGAGRGRVDWEAMAMARSSDIHVRVERVLDEGREIVPGLTRARWLIVAACALPLICLAAVIRPARVRAQQAPPTTAPASVPAPVPTAPKMNSDQDERNPEAASERIDRELARFKAENRDRLPEQFQANVAQLNTYRMVLAQAAESIRRLQEQKLTLETQVQNNLTNLNYFRSLAEERSEPSKASGREEYRRALDQRILSLRAEIAAMREQFAANHPSLRKAEASLAAMENKSEEAGAADADPQPSQPIRVLTAANEVLKAQLQDLDLQLQERLRQSEEIRSRIAAYESRVESSLRLEREYAELVAAQRENQVNRKKFYIHGEVARTGEFPLAVPTRVLEALVNAGGFKEFADQEDIAIVRLTGERLNFNFKEVIRGKNVQQNVFLQAGDIIVVK